MYSAQELRQKIIDVCSVNGGHIGASLGAVELTLALHAEFSLPKDSIVWDIGHQTYAHKILTGREGNFAKLRKKGGLCGFTSRTESPFDVFGAGHSSTSISAALGIAEAKRLKGDKSWTVAVIGDGGLTAGLAFEALNQAGASSEPRLLIVINDNNLSIGANVGALDRWAFGTEREPRKFFESLGFRYEGPMDGHDVDKMRKAFSAMKAGTPERVKVLHVLTTKGKGFAPAEKEPVRFHGVGPFDKLTGQAEPVAPGKTYSKIFGEQVSKLAEEKKDLIAITAAMADGTGLVGFAKKYPDRFYDVGIAEAHAVVFAGGLATQGLRPVVAIYSTFLQRAVDSIIHDIALQDLNVVLCIDRAGLVGADGPTHHGAFDIPILRAIPNVSIAAPSSEEDLREMMSLALDQHGVKAIRYPRGLAKARAEGSENVQWGKARIAKKALSGKKLAIWAIGTAVHWAEEAIEGLKPELRDRVELVDARFAKPLDVKALTASLVAADAMITLEDGAVAGGFGSAVVEAALASGISLPKKVIQLGIEDRWIEPAEIHEQREELGLSIAQIGKTIADLLA